MSDSGKLKDLIQHAASSITMANVEDLSDIEDLQSVFDDIASCVGEISDLSDSLKDETASAASSASDIDMTLPVSNIEASGTVICPAVAKKEIKFAIIVIIVLLKAIFSKDNVSKTKSYSQRSYQPSTPIYQQPEVSKTSKPASSEEFCGMCGSKAGKDATFCPNCGSKL